MQISKGPGIRSIKPRPTDLMLFLGIDPRCFIILPPEVFTNSANGTYHKSAQPFPMMHLYIHEHTHIYSLPLARGLREQPMLIQVAYDHTIRLQVDEILARISLHPQRQKRMALAVERDPSKQRPSRIRRPPRRKPRTFHAWPIFRQLDADIPVELCIVRRRIAGRATVVIWRHFVGCERDRVHVHFRKSANAPVGEELDAAYGQRVAERFYLEVGPGALKAADGNGCGVVSRLGLAPAKGREVPRSVKLESCSILRFRKPSRRRRGIDARMVMSGAMGAVGAAIAGSGGLLVWWTAEMTASCASW